MFLSQLRHLTGKFLKFPWWCLTRTLLNMQGKKSLKGWHLTAEIKWKICGTALHKWKSLGHGSEHNFESGRDCKHVDLSVSLIRGIRQWWRGFYSNTVSLALKLKAFYLQLQILLDLILSCLEISPLSCTHFPACNLTCPWYLHYLSVVLHNFSRWKFSLKSDLSLSSLEFQIVLPSSVDKEYRSQNPYVIKPQFDLVTNNLEFFWWGNYLLLLTSLSTSYCVHPTASCGSIFVVEISQTCQCCCKANALFV